MGTSTQRARKDESIGYTAQIRPKQGGALLEDRQPRAGVIRARARCIAADGRLAHLGSVFSIARPPGATRSTSEQWPTPAEAISRSKARQRRPTLAELDQLMEHFQSVRAKRKDGNDMQSSIAFAILSTRRLDEICRATFEELDAERSRIIVRNMKHPGEKIGNDQWCDLLKEALRIALAQPHRTGHIFPASHDAVSAAFTRACKVLDIQDLYFHDMRHGGAGRLFEIKLTTPQVAAVTGHRSWASLQCYTHLRQTGDRFVGWKWIDEIPPAPQQSPRSGTGTRI